MLDFHERSFPEAEEPVRSELVVTAAASLAEPTSYFAMRAGDRLGVSPLDRVLAEPRPWVGLAADPEAAAEPRAERYWQCDREGRLRTEPDGMPLPNAVPLREAYLRAATATLTA